MIKQAVTTAVILLLAVQARASEKRFELAVKGCGDLKRQELTRLLTIETADIIKKQPGVRVLEFIVECQPDRMRIVIHNPQTGREVERFIPLVRPDQPGGERIVALAASQLLVNEWLELFSTAPEKGPEAYAPPVVVTKKRNLSASAHLAVSMRDLSTPYLLYGARLRFGLELEEYLVIFADLSFDAGRAERKLGSVEALLTGLGLGANLNFLQSDPFVFGVALIFSGRYVRLSGSPGMETATSSASDGMVGEALLTIGPGFSFSGVRIGLDLGGGFTFPGVKGKVAGEADVTLSGPWILAALTVETCF
jgi:hypothetical protein